MWCKSDVVAENSTSAVVSQLAAHKVRVELRNPVFYGAPVVAEAAMALSVYRKKALEVGCGSGGRVITALLDGGFEITALK